jgi:hypothetical protein
LIEREPPANGFAEEEEKVTNMNEMIRNTLGDFVNQKLAFTVLDVTKKVQEKNPGIMVNHTNVRNTVEFDFFKDHFGQKYNRKVINVGEPVLPYLYFPKDQEKLIGQYKPNIGAQSLEAEKKEKEIAGHNRKFTMIFGQ